MPKTRKIPAEAPAPAPKKVEVNALNASFDRLVLTMNGLLNQASAILQRRMDEGFRKLEELIATKRP